MLDFNIQDAKNLVIPRNACSRLTTGVTGKANNIPPLNNNSANTISVLQYYNERMVLMSPNWGHARQHPIVQMTSMQLEVIMQARAPSESWE